MLAVQSLCLPFSNCSAGRREGAEVAFAVTPEHNGDTTTLRLSGELDLAATPLLDGQVRELVNAGRCRLVVDLGGLEFCDSSGLAGFVRGNQCCRRAGGWLRVTGQQGRVARLLAMTGLDEVLWA
jgi:anti-anti-sigma factor